MTRPRNPWRKPRALLSVLCSLLLTLVAIPLTATAAETDAELTIEQYIAGHVDEVPTFAPGEDVIFTINVQCSSTETGTCLDAVLVDELPEPLEFDEDTPMSITPNIATGTVDGRTLTVRFNGAGFEAGQIPTLTVNARVPARVSGDFDARTLRNPVSISASNADPVSDTVALKLAIPTSLDATATKSASPNDTLPALPGRAASFTIAGASDSNVSVDALVLTDPADLSATTFDRLAVTGLRDLEVTGADRVAFDWYDGEDWHEGAVQAIPDDPDALLPSNPAAIRGLRLSFTRNGDRLATGARAQLRIETVSRDNFGDLGADQTIAVHNTVAATVERGEASDTDTASASVRFQKQPVGISVTKRFTADELVSGRTTTATITTVNAVMPVSRVEISEPAAGRPDLAAQGLSFGGFVVDPDAPQVLMWPTGAERAEITYRYATGDPETLSTTTRHTLPESDPARSVTGFTVVYTADDDGIESRATGVLPFRVTAGAVTVEEGVTSTNTVAATATSNAPDTGSDEDSASLTLLPLRVRVAAGKTIVRDTIWAHPGTTDTVSLTGRVAQSSTVGSQYLTLTDADQGFWDYLDLRRIHSTDIPANAVLTVSSFDGTSWLPLTAPVTGPVQSWNFTPTTEQRAGIVGLRFHFEPKTAGDLLPAGFNVAPRFDVSLRRTLRSDQGVGTNAAATIANEVTVEVGNPVAIEPVRTDAAGDTMTLRPTDAGGTLWLATKRWVDPIDGSQVDAGSVSALSDELRTAVLAWGTDGLSLSRLSLLDDPNYANPAASFYDAFDLVRIQPITPATDPQIGKDKVGKVELYSSATGGWVDITAAACPTTAACDGRFVGYPLTAEQQRTTLAARLTFVPGSASETGEIALSNSAERQVRLDFRLRRTLRSDPAQYVLGETHGQQYNSGTAGTVTNRAIATGVLTEPDAGGGSTVSSTTSSAIGILDQPLNVSLTKQFDQTELGLPQRATTAAGDYPLVTAALTATNQTAGTVPQLVVTDGAGTSDLGGYARLDLHQIELPGLPAGLTAADVTVELTTEQGQTRQYSVADAQQLTPAQLADVVGVKVSYGAYDNLAEPGRPLVAAGATARVLLTFRLRAEVRGSDGSQVVEGDQIVNTARAVVLSPGGIVCAGEEACDRPAADASDNLAVVQPTYSVVAGKSFNWTSRYEDQAATGYVVTLTGQPEGTARTKLLTLTDDAPTFWNAFDLASIPSITVPDPMNELRLSVLTGVDFAESGGTLDYWCEGSTDLTSCWRTGQWQQVNAAGQVSLALPAGVTAAQVRGVRIDAQRRVDGTVVQWERPANPTLTVRLNVTRRATLNLGPDGSTTTAAPTTRAGQPTAPGEPVQAVTTDRVTVSGIGAWLRNTSAYSDTRTATATTQLRHRVNAIKVEKSPGKGTGSQAPRYDLDAAIPYQVKITNIGAWRMTGLELTDRIDLIGGASPLVVADVDPVFTVKLDGAAVTGFTTSLDPATGKLAIGVPDGFVVAPGQVLLVTANLRFRDRLEAGTEVTNTVTATADRPFETCEYTIDAVAQQPLADRQDCSARTTVVTAASSPMSVTKSVKGTGAGVAGAEPGDPNYDDLGVVAVGEPDASACAYSGTGGFYSYPCTPITRPGGRQTWRMTVANNGNVPANTISAIDVLPAPGDTGVVVGTSRKSRFATSFLGEVEFALPATTADYTIRTFLTTATSLVASCNKADILDDTKPSGQDDCGIDWQEFTDATPKAVLADATAVKFLLSFTDPAAGLDPGEKFSVTFSTRSPAYAEVADPTTVEPVAWNSVAVGARTADFGSFAARASLVTEPRKVGVALASGALDLAKRVQAPAGAAWLGLLPGSYDLNLACTSQGKTVPLRTTATTSSAGKLSVPAGGVAHYNGSFGVNLPLGAECAVTETAVQGAQVSYSADSVVATRSYAGVPNIAHGYAGTATAGALTVTNTYREAGFTVAKAVTGPTALDAAGEPVPFKDATVTANCSFLGSEVVPPASRTFDVRDESLVTFASLPAGAECRVAETYPAGAAATSIEVTQDGDTEQDDASRAEFTLLAGAPTVTAVALTNRYTVGAVTITKQLTGPGAGAWGDQPFEAELRCTHADADPALVYSARHTLTRSDTVWKVTDLPTGADCTVTEIKAGGATAATVTGGRFSVGDDPAEPAAVTLTNRFEVGTVEVTKRVQANGVATSASPWADASFEVTLACTRAVDGANLAITIPGGATRTLTRGGGWKATYAGLPTGASCAVTEGDASIAGQPAPTVSLGAPVIVGSGSTAAITVTNNYRAGKLSITKTLTGVGAGFFSRAEFSVSCTLDGYASPVYTTTGVAVTRSKLYSDQLGPLPFGADCTVTETATGGADATPAPQVIEIVPNAEAGDIAVAAFTNAFSAGRVTLTKTLIGEAAGETWATGATFTLAVKCGLTAAGPYSHNADVTIKGGQQVTLRDGASDKLFPVGTHCWATETNTQGAVTSSVDHDSFATAVVVAADPNTVQDLRIGATNSYTYGGLTISKTVVAPSLDPDGDGTALEFNPSFQFTLGCTLAGRTITTPTTIRLTKQDGAWPDWTMAKLPTGASCTLSESTRPGAVSTTSVLSRTGQPDRSGTQTISAFPLSEGGVGANRAAFTNNYGSGTLELTKQLSGDGVAAWATAPITVRVRCSASTFIAGSQPFLTRDIVLDPMDFKAAPDRKAVISVSQLPAGATCVLSELATGGSNSQSGLATVTIANGGPQGTTPTKATITNTYTVGSVSVAKALLVNGAPATNRQPWASGRYTMTLQCTRVVDGAVETLLLPDPTKVITGAGTATWSGLPTGAKCSIAEDRVVDYPTDTPSQPVPTKVTGEGQTLTIGGTGSTTTATITNEFDHGSVTITKALTGEAAESYATGTFAFSLACTLDGATGTVFSTTVSLSRATGLSSTIQGIPQGAICTVTETGTAGATSTTPASRSRVLDPIVAGQAQAAAFSNDFRYAGFTVTKTVDNGGALDADGRQIDYHGSFSFTASCTFNGAEVVPTADRSFTLTPTDDGNWTTKAFSNLPSGASCTVTETGRAGAVETRVRVSQNGDTLVESTTDTTGAFTLATGDATTTAVDFTNRYATGELAITKQVTGAGATQWGGGTFTLALVCTFDHDANAQTPVVTVYDADHRLTGGQTWKVEDLPVGANCVLTEPGTAGATSTSLPAAGLTRTVAATNAPITVTNTFSTGAAQVTKAIRVNGAATTAEPWASGTYPVTLHCTRDFDDDGVAEEFTVPGATQTITGTGTATWNNLPYGASCTVTEGTSAVTSQPQPVATVTGAGVIGVSTLRMTLTNDFTAGKLVVHKDVTGDGARWATWPFSVEVGCSLTDHGTVYAKTVTLTPTAGQTSLDSEALGPIPVGSLCAVEETATGGATVVTTPDPVTIALNPDTNNVTTLSLTNEFQQGGFTVTKAVDNGGATDADGEPIGYDAANFTAACTFNGSQVISAADREFQLAGGQSKTFTGLPTGATCTVRETWSAGAASVATTLIQNGSPATDTDALNLAVGFTLKTGDAATTKVGFTNSYTTGSARVSKVTDGPGASLWADPEFTVRLVCTLGVAAADVVFDATHQVTTAQPWTVTGLPTGADCSVTETASGAANLSVVTNGSFRVGTGDTRAATVTNSYTLGAVRVTKQLTVDGAATTAEPWISGSYTVELACTRQVDGVKTPIAIPGGASRTITGAGSVTYANLPTGASCALTETESSPVAQGAVVSPATVVVGDDPSIPQAIAVTNDFHTAQLAIRKQLAGAGTDAFGSGPFDFEVSCTLAGAEDEVFGTEVRLSRAAGSAASTLTSEALGPIPVGAVCQVVETGRGGADKAADPVTVTIAEDDAANLATLTNQFSAGTVWLSKDLAGAAAGQDWATEAAFVVDVTCQVELDGVRGTVLSRRVELAGGERVNVTDASGNPSRVPLGSHCFSNEVDARGATTSTDSHTGYDTGVVVTEGTPANLQALELAVTNTFEYAGFTVTKTVVNGGAAEADGNPVGYPGRYSFEAECSLAGNSVLDADFSLAGGETKQFIGLPAGADCTVTETSAGNAAATAVTLIQNGNPDPEVSGSTASLVLQRGWFPLWQDSPVHNVAAFTNGYTTGAATFTKIVAGSGASSWGAGPFTLRLVCTLDTDADPATEAATVFDGSREVSQASPVWAVTQLPTGADCTVSETATGGANTSAGSEQFVVGADPAVPIEVDLTNTFTTGSIRVTKTILVDGEEPDAAPYAAAEYEVQLRCTREVNGEDVAVDIPGDDAPAGDPSDGVRSITGAGSVTYPGLPTGADCIATEVSAGFPLPNSQVSEGETAIVSAGSTAELGIANDYHTGDLVVSKLLAGDGAASYAAAEFRFDVRCTLADLAQDEHLVFTATGVSLSRAAGLTSASLGPIPVGADCTVTEVASGGADQPAAPVTVRIVDGQPTTAELTNTFTLGSVRIRLGVTIDQIPTVLAPYVTGRYDTELSCTRQVNGETVPVAIPGGAGWTMTGPGERLVTGLPVGAECIVSQPASSLTPRAVSYHPVGGPAGSGAVTVVSGEPATLDILDDFTLGTLTVTKQLTGDGAADYADQQFGFSLVCSLAEDGVEVPHVVYTGSVTLSRETGLTSAPLGPIAVGAECVVTETATGGATVPAPQRTITITTEPTANAVTMANDFQVGTVTVAKRITVDGVPSGAEPYASGSYTVELSCTRLVDGREVAVAVPGGSTRTITGSGSVDYTGLPLGADCRVSEPASSLAIPADQVGIQPTSVVVGTEPVTTTVTNDFRTGTLVLRWTQTGVGRGFAGSARFTVDCTLDGAAGSVFHKDVELTPVDGQDAVETEVLGPIPIGAVCTVTEHTADGADAIAEPVTIGGGETMLLAELGNAYSAGVVTVTKQLTGPGAALHTATTFSVAVTCAATADGEPYLTADLEITGEGSADLVDAAGDRVLLPAGIRCWAAETDSGGAQASRVDHDRFETAAMVTTDDAQTLQQLTITVTNEFALASLPRTGPGTGSWWLLALTLVFLGVGTGLARWGMRPQPRRVKP